MNNCEKFLTKEVSHFSNPLISVNFSHHGKQLFIVFKGTLKFHLDKSIIGRSEVQPKASSITVILDMFQFQISFKLFP
jgi:hypothetical protein